MPEQYESPLFVECVPEPNDVKQFLERCCPVYDNPMIDDGESLGFRVWRIKFCTSLSAYTFQRIRGSYCYQHIGGALWLELNEYRKEFPEHTYVICAEYGEGDPNGSYLSTRLVILNEKHIQLRLEGRDNYWQKPVS